MSISLPHSALRNFFLIFGPIIVVLFSLSVMLPNTEAHKKVFNDQNFYGQLSAEMKKSVGYEKGQDQEQVYQRMTWNIVSQNLASPQWLQKVVETNIDRYGNWINGKTDNLELYLPTEDINAAVNANINEETKKAASSVTVKKCEELEKDKKEFCLPAQVLEGSKKFTDFVGQNLVPAGSKTGEQINKAASDIAGRAAIEVGYLQNPLNPGQTAGDVFNTVQGAPKALRDTWVWFSGWIWFIAGVYVIALAAFVLTSPLFGKNPFVEAGVIGSTIGWGTLVTVFGILFGWAITLIIGGVVRGYLLPNFAPAAIATMVGWQSFWLAFNLFVPALWIGGLGFAGGQILKMLKLGR
jgi:hypothetical protein